MQKKKKNKLFIFLIICFVLMPFLFTKGCNYMESLNQAKNSLSEPISSASVYSHIHERAYNAQGHSIRKANWTGTAVPSSGYVEDIYYNTNLSIEEVVNILDNLTMYDIFDSGSNITDYIVFVSQDQTSAIDITRWDNIDGSISYMIGGRVNNVETVLFRSFDFEEESAGWYEIEESHFDTDNFLSVFAAAYNYEVQNDKLSALFSITPFEQSSDNELSIGNLFSQLANAILLFGVAIVELFLALEPIFWNNGPTLIFILLIAGVAFALASWGLELLISLIGVFRKKRKKKK